MKRILIAIVLAVFVLTSAFAYSNGQKIYTVDSEVYEAMEALYVSVITKVFN